MQTNQTALRKKKQMNSETKKDIKKQTPTTKQHQDTHSQEKKGKERQKENKNTNRNK